MKQGKGNMDRGNGYEGGALLAAGVAAGVI